ncbi:MAG: MarR family transcriptional regulator [Lachnospiraceae bacterium]|nr:MarR family transcriptional regulator [Lachnospiraceae bacterium]
MSITINEQMKRFNLLSSEIDAAYHEAAFKLGLSDSTMLILYTAYCNGGECLLSDITLMSGASKQTINSALRKLETEEIVYLKSFEGRKKKVYLTDKGMQLAGDTVSHLIRIENEIFGSWSDEETNKYIELTKRYLTDFKEKIKEIAS